MLVNTINLASVQRVLLVRLRSIGDTVLLTPCLTALQQWRPTLEIDLLTEPLAAPLLTNHPAISRLWILPNTKTKGLRGNFATLWARGQILRQLRQRNYDLAFNLHGGSTATFLTALCGAKATVGFAANRYSSLLHHRLPPPQEIWQQPQIHCVEQQLALLKGSGIPCDSSLATNLTVDPTAATKIANRLLQLQLPRFVAIHPSAAFPSKQWAAEYFAQVIDHLAQHHQLATILAVAPSEARVAQAVARATTTNIKPLIMDDLTLSELMALLSQATLFIGNDSGPAHIAAALTRPVVVIFGSSNQQVWQPWTTQPYRVLQTSLPCIPCPGYVCKEFGEPQCIKQVSVASVIQAVDAILETQLKVELN
jgi:predicted lipopolysaccharide heptosyltransferase III